MDAAAAARLSHGLSGGRLSTQGLCTPSSGTLLTTQAFTNPPRNEPSSGSPQAGSAGWALDPRGRCLGAWACCQAAWALPRAGLWTPRQSAAQGAAMLTPTLLCSPARGSSAAMMEDLRSWVQQNKLKAICEWGQEAMSRKARRGLRASATERCPPPASTPTAPQSSPVLARCPAVGFWATGLTVSMAYQWSRCALGFGLGLNLGFGFGFGFRCATAQLGSGWHARPCRRGRRCEASPPCRALHAGPSPPSSRSSTAACMPRPVRNGIPTEACWLGV